MRKSHLFRSREGFSWVFRKGKRTESPFFKIFVLPRDTGQARFALATPRSIDKRAVIRNRLRRRVREWLRRRPEILRKSRNAAILFKKEAVHASRSKFYEELAKIFERLG